nr:glycosyltransferase [Acidimicrobiia bacterium]
AEIHYVGARRGIESTLLPATPFPHTLLDVVGLQRGISRRDLATNVRFGPLLLRARRRAGELLAGLDPRVVVSVGGYASLPAVLAAHRRRIPIVVVSYDRHPGRSSMLTARFAAACAVAFPDSPLQRAVVTGAPVRRAIRTVDRTGDRAAARERLGIDGDRFLLALTGGSLGSRVLNDAVTAFVRSHADDADLAVRHVAGPRFVDDIAVVVGAVVHQVLGYEEHMDAVYAAADLFVGRGGASTVAEVAVTGTPAILVPWSGAAGDHQTANAAWLADQDAAVLLPESRVAELGATIDRLRADGALRTELGRRAANAGTPSRRGGVADLVEHVALA